MKRVLLPLLLLIGVIVGSVSVSEAQGPWTSVGSAGTVDEADLALAVTSASQITILNSATVPANVVVRYNVVAVDGATGGPTIMTARFRDNGTGSRVVAALRQVSFETGGTTTLLTIDSNDYTASTSFQTQDEFSCSVSLDFDDNGYYIEVTLSKALESATPALQLLKIGRTLC
jgi:hypothetical protein